MPCSFPPGGGGGGGGRGGGGRAASRLLFLAAAALLAFLCTVDTAARRARASFLAVTPRAIAWILVAAVARTARDEASSAHAGTFALPPPPPTPPPGTPSSTPPFE